MCDISVGDKKGLIEKVIPFYKTYTLETSKRQDYKILSSVMSIIDEGAHLTQEGLDKIRRIIEGTKS